MGTRINVLLPHRLLNWQDSEETIRILEMLKANTDAIDAYWSEVNPFQSRSRDEHKEWIPYLRSPKPLDYLDYTGPGSLLVTVTPHVVRIRTGGRWRGFLSIQPLRDVHFQAFVAIARSFHAQEFFIYADNDLVSDLVWDRKELGECVDALLNDLGPATPYTSEIDEEWSRLWYRANCEPKELT